ncbi:FAD-dependent thymidylate synthase [uncultured Thermosynechococcus sp.]|uniref:FAD-dependent thymidylate synthase n=1 Tax=uncultured Thermosynechococcus sp. TaxID=436945 RepID=UPI00260A4267|nr:FAD-dependent thymidylate synthase [uncultured Thermosynechococcus sp.]
MQDGRVIADSISPAGVRLVTLQLTYPRFIHSELLTHRVFSRNSASSRAVPVTKMMAQVEENPVIPYHWGQNQPGMQARQESEHKEAAKEIWLKTRLAVLEGARQLHELGIHKQVVNRMLEPWMWMQTVVSSTEWDNFLRLRNHPDAQPEMQALAKLIQHLLETHEPTPVAVGEWHLPYIDAHERERYSLEECKYMSVARCARVSYYLRDGRRSDPEADLALYHRLAGADPKHLSPLEHVAECMGDRQPYANFVGWRQLRYFEERKSANPRESSTIH